MLRDEINNIISTDAAEKIKLIRAQYLNLRQSISDDSELFSEINKLIPK